MRNTIQTFLKGVNRRSPVDRQEPDRVFTLQNARLFQRDATSYVVRIEGFVDFLPQTELTEAKDLTVVSGETDTTNYTKGYRISFLEKVEVDEETNLTALDKLVDRVRLEEIIKLNLIKKQIFGYTADSEITGLLTNKNESVGFSTGEVEIKDDVIQLKEYFRIGKNYKLQFTEPIVVRETFFTPNRITLTFVEGVNVVDEPFIWLED